jgi:hypothetical protein
MSYTAEQIWRAIWEAGTVWVQQGLAPAGMPKDYTAEVDDLIFKLAGGYLYSTGRLTGYDFDEIIKRLIRDGKIILDPKVAQRAADMAELPHEDIALLAKNLRTMADVRRIMKLPKENLKQYAHLRPGSPAFREFNQRAQYIREKRIEGPESVKPVEQPKMSVVPAPVQEAHRLVAVMTVRDIGSTSSQAGRWQTLINTQQRLRDSIDQMYAARVRPELILERTKQAISEAGNSSVR